MGAVKVVGEWRINACDLTSRMHLDGEIHTSCESCKNSPYRERAGAFSIGADDTYIANLPSLCRETSNGWDESSPNAPVYTHSAQSVFHGWRLHCWPGKLINVPSLDAALLLIALGTGPLEALATYEPPPPGDTSARYL